MVDNVPEDSHGILAWTMLFINIYSVYIIEIEVAEFCPITRLHHLTQSCYSQHNLKKKGKMVSVIEIISLGSLTYDRE